MTTPPSSPHDNPAMAQLRAALERELGPDEVVAWHGWQLGRIDPRLFVSYVFAIPWTAFSVLWTTVAGVAMASAGDDGPGWIGWAFPAFGLPFIAIGLFMLARPFVPLWQRGRVLYVVTDRRALKLGLGRALEVTTVPAERIGLIERREKPDGSGSLKLAVSIGRDSDGDRNTEHFFIAEVADVAGAQAALGRIARSQARPVLPPGPASPLSS